MRTPRVLIQVALIPSLIAMALSGCSHSGTPTRGPSASDQKNKSAAPATESSPRPKAAQPNGVPAKPTDPNQTFVCELQVLITKLKAYGPTLEAAQADVKKQCQEKFEPLLCGDDEDLNCRKTFY
jgi:hypothetical protein